VVAPAQLAETHITADYQEVAKVSSGTPRPLQAGKGNLSREDDATEATDDADRTGTRRWYDPKPRYVNIIAKRVRRSHSNSLDFRPARASVSERTKDAEPSFQFPWNQSTIPIEDGDEADLSGPSPNRAKRPENTTDAQWRTLHAEH